MPNKIPDRRWQIISVNMIGELPESHCRRDIILILSPPLRRRFRPQKSVFHHKTPLLSLIPFLPPKGGSHSLRKYHHRIILVSTILTTPHMSGSVHRRRRYGSCRFCVYSFYSPSKYGRSPSVLRITGRTAYLRIGLYETSMTTVGPWESVTWLRRNS